MMTGVDQANLEARIMRSRYLGIPTLKMPTDAWVYQELIYALQPDRPITWNPGGYLLRTQ